MMLFAAAHSEAGTFHSCAAASISTSRAAAPPWRTYSCESRMPRLPPVPKSFHTRLRARFCPGVGYSVVTFDQSHSSSSATSWARPVSVPWPISERAMRITIVSSGRITTQAFTSGEPSAARMTFGPPNGMSSPSASPPPAAAAPTTNRRRSILGMYVMTCPPCSRARRGVDRRAHLLIGAAAADVADIGVDVGIGGFGLLLEQRRHRHDHPALAIAALRHVVLEPGLLHLVQGAARGKPLDRGDLLAFRRAHRHRARAHGHAVHVHGAGAALGDAAAVFGSGKADLLPQHPQERGVGVDIDVVGLSVDGETSHSQPPILSPAAAMIDAATTPRLRGVRS